MVLPIDVTLVTVTGTYLTDDGVPADGSLIFTPSISTLRDPAHDKIIKLRQTRVDLDAAGSFSVALIATDDPDLIPEGWHYDVHERIQDHTTRTWILQLPHTLASLDIADVPTSVDPSVPVYPTPAYGVSSVVGQVGDVTGAEILADPTISAALAAKADDTDITALAAVVATKADDADLDALAGVVATKADEADLTALAGVVATKADEADLAALVPYTGATADVDLGARSIRAENANVNEGTLADPTVTDLGGLQVSVTSVDCLIRSDATYGADGWLYRATVPAATLPITNNTVNHLYVTWNAGTPIYAMTTDRSIMNLSNTLPVARLLVESGAVSAQMSFGYMGRSAAIRWLLREVRVTDPVGGVVESGLTLTESATRIVNVAAGTAWFVLKYLTLPAISTGGVGVTSYLLHHTGGVWTKTSITQYNNTQYDDGANLATLTNNHYAVNWVYRSFAGPEIIIMLGEGDYLAPAAIDSTVPNAPHWIDEFYYLCGRIIVQKSASTAYRIENRTSEQFETSPILDHNDLDGIQGGTAGEYYHLTAAQLATIGSTPTGLVPYTGATSTVDLGAHSLYSNNGPFTEGVVTDPVITDAAGSAIAITSCEVLIRSDVAWGGDERLYRMTVPATPSLAVADNTVNYIYVSWNAGSPVYGATTDRYALNMSTIIPVARVGMDTGTIEYQLMYGYLAKGAAVRNQDRVLKTRGRGGIERETGLAISESATRVVTIGSGAAWFGVRRITTSAITNGVGGATMELWYHSGGAWTNTPITQYNNTQWDNGTNLVTLTANRYAVCWVFRSLVSSEIDIVLGTGDYTLAQAEASTLPAIPDMVASFYVLCGRIIVQKNAATAAAIENVSTTTFNQSAVSNHEDLSGLQGGAAGEYYHLTSAQLATVNNAITSGADVDLGPYLIYAGNITVTDGPLTDPAITDAAGSAISVASCDVLIRSDTAWGGDERLYRMTVPAAPALAVTDNDTNFIYVSWNGGSPVYAATLTRDTINMSSTVPVAIVAMSSGSIRYTLPYGSMARGAAARTIDRAIRTEQFAREAGLTLSVTSTPRTIYVDSGSVWFGNNRISLPAINSGSATMYLWYHSAGNWTSTTITEAVYTYYDDPVNGLIELNVARFVANNVYRNVTTGDLHITISDVGTYTTSSQAEASAVRTPPPLVSAFCLLVGRIIYMKNTAAPTALLNASTSFFGQASMAKVHNDLLSPQGGATGQYYHLTAAQHAAYGTATSITSGTPAGGGAPGTAGQILYDSSYLYVCVATNTWKYIPLTSF